MNDHDDELDRALFSLALEHPPADLRERILATTAYAPPPPFSLAEVIGLGVVGAVAVWLAIAIVLNGGVLFEHALGAIGGTLERTFSNVSTLAWIALGGACAFWVSLFTGTQPLALAGQRSEQREVR